MSATQNPRRELIRRLSEDSMGGIATLSDVTEAEQLVDAYRLTVIGERDAQTIEFLVKKAREEGRNNRDCRTRGDVLFRMADKISRGAIRPPLSKDADPLVVSRFDVAIEPAPEEEQILTVGCIAEDGRPVALLLNAETRAKVAEWLAPSVQLTESEQEFLRFALELAADQIALRPEEFDAADDEALASLRRLTGGAS